MTGHIKFFDAEKHYGIIIPAGISPRERKLHVFFYEDVLQGSVATGQEVEYSLLPEYPTPRALAVKPLEGRAYVPINARRKAVGYGAD
jgi:cold shock CspA family protein